VQDGYRVLREVQEKTGNEKSQTSHIKK